MTTNDYCFDPKSWTINQEGRGWRIHWALAVLIAPLMGALFLMFLPVIGFVLVGQALGKRAIRALTSISLAPRATAGEAYLAGAPPERDATGTDELEELSDEIARRRSR